MATTANVDIPQLTVNTGSSAVSSARLGSGGGEESLDIEITPVPTLAIPTAVPDAPMAEAVGIVLSNETPAAAEVSPVGLALGESPAASPQPSLTAAPAGTPAASPVPTPTPTPEPTETPKPTEAPTPAPAYTVREYEDERQGYVYAKSINLREGPGTDYDIIDEYKQYETLEVYGTSGDWYYVQIDEQYGFMLAEYVKFGAPETPSPTAKATEKPKATEAPTPEPTSTPEPTEAPTPAPTVAISLAPTVNNSSSLSDELYLVAQVVYKEGDSASYHAVANVIYNRLHSSAFPNTLEGVIYQSGQFSTSNLKTPSSAALAAVEAVFVNGNLILPGDVLYFRSASSWDDHLCYGQIGGNYFYY